MNIRIIPVLTAGPVKPELLAPCGNWEMMRSAVANGADAVYFGLEDFNARRRAENFTLAGLDEIVTFLHSHNVLAYVTLNTLIFSDELPRVADFVAAIARVGADAVIVQDLGLARLIREMAPSLPVHASTQMTQTHQAGLAVLRELGVRRVILARELSLAQIRAIAQTDFVASGEMELEVFVHGALCVSYSGQCLASESLMGRSANRGQCSQVCRLPYQLVVDGQPLDLGQRKYLLSPQDLAALDLVGELCRLGVRGLKIEGRLKSAAYVAAVTQVYRAAIDAAATSSAPYQPTPQQRIQLDHTFSRGATHGYLDDSRRNDLVQGEFPASRGIRLGRVVNVRGQFVLLQTDRPTDQPGVQAGDGVVFESTVAGNEIGGRVFAVEPYEDRREGHRQALPNRFVLTFDRQLDLSGVKVDGGIWKTDDPKVRKQLESTFSRDEVVRRVPIRAEVAGSPGGPLVIAMADEHDRVEATWPGPLQQARQHPLTVEAARQQLGRLGQSPFELREVALRGETGPVDELPVMVPKSVLNDLRRQAVEALLARRRQRSRHDVTNPNALTTLRVCSDPVRGFLSHPATPPNEKNRPYGFRGLHLTATIQTEPQAELQTQPGAAGPQLYVLVRDIAQLQALIDWTPADGLARPAMVYCEFQQIKDYAAATELARAAELKLATALPRIIRPGEEKTLEKIIASAAGGTLDVARVFLVRNLAEIEILRRRGGAELIGDHSLNAANELAADYTLSLGLTRVTPSYDLSWPQLRAMLGHCRPDLLEIVVHHHMPMFHTQHCLAAANLSQRDTTSHANEPAGNAPSSCGRPCRSHAIDLLDRNDERHPVVCDILCRNTVHNSHAQSAAQFFGDLLAAGLRHFRVELLRETPGETQALVELYTRLLAGESGPSVWRRLQEGQPVTRGTWNEKTDGRESHDPAGGRRADQQDE